MIRGVGITTRENEMELRNSVKGLSKDEAILVTLARDSLHEKLGKYEFHEKLVTLSHYMFDIIDCNDQSIFYTEVTISSVDDVYALYELERLSMFEEGIYTDEYKELQERFRTYSKKYAIHSKL